MSIMNIPGFTAEASLTPLGAYTVATLFLADQVRLAFCPW